MRHAWVRILILSSEKRLTLVVQINAKEHRGLRNSQHSKYNSGHDSEDCNKHTSLMGIGSTKQARMTVSENIGYAQ